MEDNTVEADTGGTDAETTEEPSAAAPAATPVPPPAALSGRIMYSAADPVSGRTNVFIKELGSNTPASLWWGTASRLRFARMDSAWSIAICAATCAG